MDEISYFQNEIIQVILLIAAFVVIYAINKAAKKRKPPHEPTFTEAQLNLKQEVASLLDLPETHEADAYASFKRIFAFYKQLEDLHKRARKNTWTPNGNQHDEN